MADTNINLAATSLAFSVLSFLVLSFGLIMWQFPDIANTVRGFANIQGGTSNFSMLAVMGGALSPDISLLIGFISDIMNGSFRYSVTSIVGIFAVILHWVIGRYIFGYNTPQQAVVAPITQSINIGVGKDEIPGAVPNAILKDLGPVIKGPRPSRKAAMAGGASYIQEKFNPCTIRGLGMFELTNSPMGIAALSSLFMIYLLDMITKRSPGQIGGYVGFSAAVFGLNLYAYREAKCVADTSITGLLRGIALPSVIGLASGGIAYGVMKSKYPEFLPLDAQPFDDGTPGNPQAKCGQPSENEFVCDAYKNGKKISSAVVS